MTRSSPGTDIPIRAANLLPADAATALIVRSGDELPEAVAALLR